MYFAYVHLICLSLVSCSQPIVAGHVTEPSRKDDKIPVQQIHLEIMVKRNDGTAIPKLRIEATTSVEMASAYTNSEGITRLILSRKESEAIVFTFYHEGNEIKESVHTLPSRLTNAGLVFEQRGPRRIQLSNYTAEGLYR